MNRFTPRRVLSPLLIVSVLLSAAGRVAVLRAQQPALPGAAAAPSASSAIVRKIRSANEQMQMTVNTSRIVTLGQKIPQMQVNNPDILALTPLSPTQIQISAKSTGVTQVNLWGADKKVYTINVIVFGDAQELDMVLRTQFPNAALKVLPVVNGVLISGYVDKPQHIDLIVRIAEEYYPKVINNITVGGVQQVLLHVKVMEVSRTKLRRLGFDFAEFTGNDMIASGISGLLAATSAATAAGGISNAAGTAVGSGDNAGTFSFGIVTDNNTFLGVLEALRQDNLLKILAEPTLVTVSGRPAFFNVGGEIPVPVPQSLGTISIEWKRYGTQVDFVPIVLGDGRIRLEVRPRVSELDNTHSITVAATTVPGIRSREVDTGVEMQAGQTLALAGLVQTRVEAENRGLPWISEVPYLGVPFRAVQEEMNEVELLILVTPELVEAMDADEVPLCGPGARTTSPCDWDLFMKGFIEVPNCCPAYAGEPYGGQPFDATVEGSVLPGDGMILDEHEVIEAPASPAAGGSIIPHNRYTLSKPPSAGRPPGSAGPRPAPKSTAPKFIGPIGYDLVK